MTGHETVAPAVGSPGPPATSPRAPRPGNGASPTLDRPRPLLGDEFAGAVLGPGGEGYEAARRVYNAAIDRRPALIARCTGVADVITAVNHGRESGMRVAVYGGGHSFAGHSVCDDGLVIDLRPLKGIRVDPAARTAAVQAGVTWGELDRETQAFGLAVTGGRDPSTGVGGLTLGSGSGWLERSLGRSCDQLRAVDVVTASGAFLTASPTQNPELFWGLRGGGGNFGVATSFEFALAPVGPTVLGGMLLYPHTQAGEVLRSWREFIAAAPDQVAGAANLLTAPPAPFVPDSLRGQPALMLIAAYLGPPAAGEEALAPLRSFGPPAADLVAPLPYTALQGLAAPVPEQGDRFYATFDFVSALDDPAIDTLVRAAALPGRSMAILVPFGGALARVPEDATAFGHRSEPFGLNIITQWPDPSGDEAHIGAARALAAGMRGHTTGGGVYLNATSDADPSVVAAAFGAEAYRRLGALKDRYDPGNLFRLNHNIPPTRAWS